MTTSAAPTTDTPTAAEQSLGLNVRLLTLVADGDAGPALRELAADVLTELARLHDVERTTRTYRDSILIEPMDLLATVRAGYALDEALASVR